MPNFTHKLFRLSSHLWLTAGMLVVIVTTFIEYVHAEKLIDRANEARQQSILLAGELRQSSDDLTRMVRTYAVTGNPIYKQHYQEILDIRDGRKPRPVEYQGIYWDLVTTDDTRPRPTGEAMPLLTLMRQSGFTEDEFAKLAEAKHKSDDLTRTEFAAMALLEATDPPTETNRARAIAMLHDAAYHQAKAAIMGPIGEFYRMADQRTLAAVRAAETQATGVRMAFILLGVLLILLFLSFRKHQRAILGGSLEEVHAGISHIGSGDSLAAIAVAKGMEGTVLGHLRDTQIELARLGFERAQAEREQHKLNRALRLLGDCNLALVSATDEPTLLADVCRLAVEAGGYLMVWVGYAEQDSEKSVRSMAQYGHNADSYLESIRISWDETKAIGRGPTGSAISARATQINQNYLTNQKMAPWRESAQQYGFRSSIALPLNVAQQTIGAITLYATETDAFNAEEVKLLEELARNVGYGIEALRTRDQRIAAEAASRAKSTFLANMSHELRTPMNAIMGMTDLALRHATEPKLRDQLGKIALASQHLLQVINDILDISKIEAERLILEKTSFKLGEVIENLISLIGHKVTDKNLQLITDIPADLAAASFQGDPLRLGQVLLNLASNAVKFTNVGAITVRCRMLEETATDVLLHFAVQDTGIGISTEAQGRLFSAFEQADNSMTRKFGGTGLGLAISKRLVHLMGGNIGLDSTTGSGSLFWFTARLGKVSEAIQTATSPLRDLAMTKLKDQYRGARILLVEDEPINQEVSLALLEDIGLDVDLAEDGVQAVDMAGRKAYDLILMDMQMPNLNGIDATRQLRGLPAYARTPIVAMTANAFDEDRQRCLDAGMNDHIGKPVNPNVLYDVLLKWLDTGVQKAQEQHDSR